MLGKFGSAAAATGVKKIAVKGCIQGFRSCPGADGLCVAPQALESTAGSQVPSLCIAWIHLRSSAGELQTLMAAVVVLEGFIRREYLKPWWRLWAFPTPSPEDTGVSPGPSLLPVFSVACHDSSLRLHRQNLQVLDEVLMRSLLSHKTRDCVFRVVPY